MRSALLALCAAFLLLLVFATTAVAAPRQQGVQPLKSVYELVAKSGPVGEFDTNGADFDILHAVIDLTDFEPILSATSSDGITLLAPNDDAFMQTVRDLDLDADGEKAVYMRFKDHLEELFGPEDFRSAIRGILSYHIIVGQFDSFDISSGPLMTLSGEEISMQGLNLIDGNPDLPNAALVFGDSDIQASNGFLHTIDRLLFPASLPAANGAGPVTPPNAAPTEPPSGSETPVNPNDPGDSGFDPNLTPDGSDPPSNAPTTTPPTTPGTTAPTTTNPSASGTSESSASSEEASCFPASSIVHLKDGSDIRISQLAAAHTVRASESAMSKVYFFSHKEDVVLHTFVRIGSEDGHIITLTDGHYLYANNRLTAAGSVRVGDVLRTLDGPSRVRSVESVKEVGLFAPHTLHGDIVVNRVVASSYTTTVQPRLAHLLLAPFRALVRLGLSDEPLGSLLYGGSPRMAALVPKGASMY